jgi:hypothetical protein
MPSLSVLNLGDGVFRKLKDSDSVHSISIHGIGQTVTNNSVDLDVESAIEPFVDEKIAIVAQLPTFSVDFTTGELIYSTAPYTFDINQTTGNLEWEVTA